MPTEPNIENVCQNGSTGSQDAPDVQKIRNNRRFIFDLVAAAIFGGSALLMGAGAVFSSAPAAMVGALGSAVSATISLVGHNSNGTSAETRISAEPGRKDTDHKIREYTT